MTLAQLRCRTEFSFREAFGKVVDVSARLAAIGAPAAGIVDGGTWGHVKWAKQLNRHGVKPLFGVERPLLCEDGKRPRFWLLATDMKKFYQLSTALAADDITLEQQLKLLKTAKGVVRFAGAALTDPATFDFIDINPASKLSQMRALKLHKKTKKPLVITSDNAHPAQEHFHAFAAFSRGTRATPQWILSLEELRAELSCLTDKQFAKAVADTNAIAERCASTLPVAPIIKVEGDLSAVIEKGRNERLRLGHLASWTPAHQARLDHEVKMINSKNYESYFLVVADLVQWAKTNMLVGPARGSSAGSLVCYLLRITEVDPLEHELLFERFIDVSRNDLPDIDIDFSNQPAVFEYLPKKYGRAKVARIGSINNMRARTVIGKVCQQLGIPDREKFDVLDVLIEYSSGDSRYGHSLEDTLTQTEPGKRFAEKYPEAKLMFDLENHASHTGVHAAGVIVCNEPVSDYCTVGSDGVAQLDKPDAEALGLLKIDALGLRTLAVIEDSGAVTSAELYALKLNDPKVLQVFNDKHYAGIFQFEGQAQRRVSAEVQIDSFKQIDHITALARPGPLGGGASQKYIARAAGREEVAYRHPSMAAYLTDTMGVVLYQEQVMRICFEIGKFSWEVVSEIRKAMSGRKGKEYFDRRGEQFVAGATSQGMSKADAEEIWSEICTFGAWGMNRSFSACTHVKLAHPNQFLGTDPTIQEVYDFYKKNPSPWVRQRKVMPKLLSVGKDGIARPTMAVDITYNGHKKCISLIFSDGREAICSYDHKFIINGRWQRCGDAKIGDEFEASERKCHIKNHSFNSGAGKAWRKGRVGAGETDFINGRETFQRKFRTKMKEESCERCGKKKRRMIVHHNDFCHGKKRPNDLAWVCDGCHKTIHIQAGKWLTPYKRGWSKATPAILVAKEDAGVRETYDIHMPNPDHNYVLSNGIVTHNSHTVSYAIISYWCAWLKAYHPLAYFAACLRNAKDDAQAIEILREANQEGHGYVAFDPARSAVDWAVVGGELIGGFKNVDGYGPAKAVKAVEMRRLGKLDLEKLAKHKVKFTQLYPMQAEWGHAYEDPIRVGCAPGSRFTKINALPPKGDVLLLARVDRKELRDENETIRLARRGGRRIEGQTLFLDVFASDDSGVPITLRFDRFKFKELGAPAAEKLKANDVVMVRGYRIENFAMVKVKAIRCLNRPEVFQHA